MPKIGAFFDTLLNDVRYALRLLKHSPLFTLTAVLSLAIGIGADTVVFSLANAFLFRPPDGVTEPRRLVEISSLGLERTGFRASPVRSQTFNDIRLRATNLEGVAGLVFGDRTLVLSGPAGNSRVTVQFVTSNYFDVLGVRPAMGRLFDPTDDALNDAEPVAVVSHALWQRVFNGQPEVAGSAVRLAGYPLTIVGATDQSFSGASVLWVPAELFSTLVPPRRPGMPDLRLWSVRGRLASGISLAQASAEMEAIALDLQDPSRPDDPFRLEVSPLANAPSLLKPLLTQQLIYLLAFVSVVLIAACINLSGLLLTRATVRRREIAVRLASGAGRGRLTRQLLTETTVLCLLGGAVAVFLTYSLVRLLSAWLPFAGTLPLAIDFRVLVFVTVLSVAAAVVSGLAPALQASRTDVMVILKDEPPGASGRLRLRNLFVTAQIALSVVLLFVTGSFLRGLANDSSPDFGFDPVGVEIASLDFSAVSRAGTPAAAFAQELMDRVRTIPGVQSVATVRTVPGSRPDTGAIDTGVQDVRAPGASLNVVGPGYFDVLKLPLLAGRDFTLDDRLGSTPVVIVSEAAARQFWPGENALGKTVRRISRDQIMTVIGIARDTREGDAPAGPFLYLPLEQQDEPADTLTLMVRSTNGQRLNLEIAEIIRSTDPNLAMTTANTLEAHMSSELQPLRVAAGGSAILGMVALFLAAIGIHAVASYAVAARTREIGIRISLGAQRRDVLALVLRQAMLIVAVGAVVGLGISAAGMRLFGGLFEQVPAFDSLPFAGAAILCAAVGMFACYLPARRATSITPMDALRHE